MSIVKIDAFAPISGLKVSVKNRRVFLTFPETNGHVDVKTFDIASLEILIPKLQEALAQAKAARERTEG